MGELRPDPLDRDDHGSAPTLDAILDGAVATAIVTGASRILTYERARDDWRRLQATMSRLTPMEQWRLTREFRAKKIESDSD